MYLVLMLMVMYVCYSVVKESKRKRHTVFFCQYICDDTYSTVVTKDEEEFRIKEIEKRREQYLEWIDNCRQVFDNKKIASDRKICRRTIDGVA